MLPKHIGFIMDGNGRWAQSHGLLRPQGYQKGLDALRAVLKRCSERGVEAVSVYAFSTENNQRPQDEIDAVCSVVKGFNDSYVGDYQITYMGDVYSLPDSLVRSIERVESATADNVGLKLNIALNYGAKSDILHAAKVCCDHGDFSLDTFERHLGSSHLPALDLIVRSGGEKRLSNFMLYEAAYAELMFLDKLWPDMTAADVDAILNDFENRVRKFGK